MTRFAIRIQAGPNERLTTQAAQQLVGQTTNLTIAGEVAGQCRITKAEIAQDGTAMVLTLEPINHQTDEALTVIKGMNTADYSVGVSWATRLLPDPSEQLSIAIKPHPATSIHSDAYLQMGPTTRQPRRMTHFRLRWAKLGGHIHVGVWSGTEHDTTHGCNGRLCFRPNEWDDFIELIEGNGLVELVREEDALAVTAYVCHHPAPPDPGEG